MAAILPADTTSPQWGLVKAYCEARIAELTEECISVGSTDEQRRNSANRIEELRDLLSAPSRLRAKTEYRMANAHKPNGVY